MLSRRVSLVVAGLLLAGLTGCAPTPAPTPTPTGFASEDEAFAAAEETYRAYVDELNAYHAGDPEADPLSYLRGDVLSRDQEILEQADEAGLRFEGESKVESIKHQQASVLEGAASVTLEVCLDDREVRLINADGEDVTLPDVPKEYVLEVELATVSEDELAIVKSDLVRESC